MNKITEYGPMLDGKIQAEIDDLKANPDTLTSAFDSAAMAAGRFLDFSAMEPDAGFALTVQEGETLYSLARRFSPIIEGNNLVDVARTIAAKNDLIADGSTWEDVRLSIGQTIFIPLPPGVEIHTMEIATSETSPSSIAQSFNEQGLIPAPFSNDPDLAAIIGALNPELTEATPPASTFSITNLTSIKDDFTRTAVNYPAYEDFTSIYAALEDSDPAYARDIPVPLYISEGAERASTEAAPLSHHKTAYAYATGFRDALTGGAQGNPILAYRESRELPLSKVLDAIEPFNDSDIAIFSQSYAAVTKNGDYALNIGSLYSQTAHFVGAGNDHTVGATNGYRQSVPDAFGPRSYAIGATEYTGSHILVADYSSVGADFVAPPLATHNGADIGGTSFATPMVAEASQIMNNRFGGILTYEEIMAAASMSTNMSISETIGKNPDGTPIVDLVAYGTNGGGRPHNDRAGAGMIDVHQWQETLTAMAQIKSRMQHDSGRISDQVSILGLPDVTTVDGRTYYNYEVTVMSDMTLDRMAFILPTENDTDQKITITSPSGFVFTMHPGPYDTASTSAFALEDVRAGDKFTIPDNPLAVQGGVYPGVVMHGFGDGSVVQVMRDHLLEQGIMPKPNTAYIGSTPAADALIAAPADEKPGFFASTYNSVFGQ